MSDQGVLFSPPAEAPQWWQIALACEGCKRITTRPPRSEKPCEWCGGALHAVDVA